MTNLLTTLAANCVILSKTEQTARCCAFQSEETSEPARAQALHDLVSSNIRLAHKVAKQHIRRGVDFNDLLAQATEGIIIAAGKFDVTKKASFTTYAKQWMRAKCQEFVQANAGILHCGSRTSKRLWSSLQKAQKALGLGATPEAIAEHLKLDVDDVQACLRTMSSRGVSMDAPLSADGGTVASIVPSRIMRQDARLERTQNSENIARVLHNFSKTLNNRQRAILVGRIMHDLLGNEQQCAKTFGVSKQRVGQIEKQLRLKLQSHFVRCFGAQGVEDIIRAAF